MVYTVKATAQAYVSIDVCVPNDAETDEIYQAAEAELDNADWLIEPSSIYIEDYEPNINESDEEFITGGY